MGRSASGSGADLSAGRESAGFGNGPRGGPRGSFSASSGCCSTSVTAARADTPGSDFGMIGREVSTGSSAGAGATVLAAAAGAAAGAAGASSCCLTVVSVSGSDVFAGRSVGTTLPFVMAVCKVCGGSGALAGGTVRLVAEPDAVGAAAVTAAAGAASTPFCLRPLRIAGRGGTTTAEGGATTFAAGFADPAADWILTS